MTIEHSEQAYFEVFQELAETRRYAAALVVGKFWHRLTNREKELVNFLAAHGAVKLVRGKGGSKVTELTLE